MLVWLQVCIYFFDNKYIYWCTVYVYLSKSRFHLLQVAGNKSKVFLKILSNHPTYSPTHRPPRINSVSCSHKLHTEANLSGSECPKFATFSMGYMLKPYNQVQRVRLWVMGDAPVQFATFKR